MAAADWARVVCDLRSALDLLHDRGFVVLGEPVDETSVRRGLLRRRRPRPVRYVQVLRTEDVLSGECVGARSLGGTWEMDGATVRELCRLGWRTPEQAADEWAESTPNFAVHVPQDQVADLTDLLVVSLQLLGADPDDLVLTGG